MINQYGGSCQSCRGYVAAQAGQRVNHGNGWQTYHNECVPVRTAPPPGAHHGWHRAPLLAFDVEATCPEPMAARIVSAALVLPDGTERTWLVDPGVPIPAEATEVHGITDERVQAEGVPSAVALAEISALIATQIANGTPLVAFCASYDITTLHTELARHSLAPIDWSAATVVDPFVLHNEVEPQWFDSKKLGDLCRYYEVELTQAHEALADTRAALGLARSIAARHQRIAELPPRVLHDSQVKWHYAQASGLKSYYERRGIDKRVSLEWPLETLPR